MKIQIASDLHLEFIEHRFPRCPIVEPTDADVLALAGYIHRHMYAIDVFRDWLVPVIYFSGNHEFYDVNPFGLMDQLRKRSTTTDVHYLEKNELL